MARQPTVSLLDATSGHFSILRHNGASGSAVPFLWKNQRFLWTAGYVNSSPSPETLSDTPMEDPSGAWPGRRNQPRTGAPKEQLARSRVFGCLSGDPACRFIDSLQEESIGRTPDRRRGG